MSRRATQKDFESRCWVSASPMPDEAPVTIATGGMMVVVLCKRRVEEDVGADVKVKRRSLNRVK